MKIEQIDGADARAVLRGIRGAVLGAGPAIALGGAGTGAGLDGREVPAGTAVVLTTSGSTGHPKSVILSRSALTSSAMATSERIGSGVWLLALPPGYIAGLQVLARSLIAGREPALLSGVFSAQAFAAAAGSLASSVGGIPVPAYTSLVPAQLQTLLDAADDGVRTHLDRFEAVLVGGQSLPPSLAERAERHRVRVVRTYGSTETSGGCVYDGVPLPGVDLRIREGEVEVSGPMLADGYLDDPARTEAAFAVDPDGRRWYRTGDLGTVDGVLRISGRRDNVLVSGGVNVSLDRVETLVRAHAALAGAVVVAAPDERWGEVPVVVTDREVDPGILDLLRATAEHEIGVAARPREIIRLAAIPLLATGKPDRPALRSIVASRAR